MKKNACRKLILLGMAFSLGGTPVWAEETPLEGEVTVAIHNDAGVPAGTLIHAEHTAREIFKRAGVDVVWVNCGFVPAEMQIGSSCHVTEFPKHLQLVIARRSKNLADSTLGVSFLGEDGTGCYSDIFFGPTEELNQQLHSNLATLLGHVMAHEIAHLLLGTNSHSGRGIMRAHWNEQDLADAGRGGLLFTSAQGRTMREKLSVSASPCRTERASVAFAPNRD